MRTQQPAVNIVGAKGYIGYGVTKALRESGAAILETDIRKDYWGTPNALEINPRMDVRTWNPRNYIYDPVIFLAGLHKEPEGLDSGQLSAWHNANEDIHMQAIECARDGKRVIFTSSSQMWLDPDSAYGQIKLETTQELLRYPNATTIVLGTVYGGPTYMRPTTYFNEHLRRDSVPDARGKMCTPYEVVIDKICEAAYATPNYIEPVIMLARPTMSKVFTACDHEGGPAPTEHPTLSMAKLLDLPHPELV